MANAAARACAAHALIARGVSGAEAANRQVAGNQQPMMNLGASTKKVQIFGKNTHDLRLGARQAPLKPFAGFRRAKEYGRVQRAEDLGSQPKLALVGAFLRTKAKPKILENVAGHLKERCGAPRECQPFIFKRKGLYHQLCRGAHLRATQDSDTKGKRAGRAEQQQEIEEEMYWLRKK